MLETRNTQQAPKSISQKLTDDFLTSPCVVNMFWEAIGGDGWFPVWFGEYGKGVRAGGFLFGERTGVGQEGSHVAFD